MNLFLSPVSLLLLFCIHLSFLFSFFFFIFPPLFFFWTPFPLLHFFFLDVFSFPRSSNNFFFFSFWRIKIFFILYLRSVTNGQLHAKWSSVVKWLLSKTLCALLIFYFFGSPSSFFFFFFL